MITEIEIGGNYTFIKDGESVEVIEFKTIEITDDSYAKEIEVVVYIDDDSSLQCMEITKFGNEVA